MSPRFWALLGPTGVGKTRTALALAAYEDVEIVGLDSRQLYKRLDIGTAKPSSREQAVVPHHMIDLLEPDQRWDAMEYAHAARGIIEQVANRGHVPLVVGGTGFYFEALVGNLSEGLPKRVDSVRASLERELARSGSEQLWEQLNRVDPETAAKLHPTDKSRIIRALEVMEVSGVPLSTLGKLHPPQPWGRPSVVVLHMEAVELKRKIRQRIESMIAMGWMDEIRGLLEHGYDPSSPAMSGLGYAELIKALSGEMSLDEAKERIYHRTWQYAKRQITWFKRFPKERWVRVDDGDQAVRDVLALFGSI